MPVWQDWSILGTYVPSGESRVQNITSKVCGSKKKKNERSLWIWWLGDHWSTLESSQENGEKWAEMTRQAWSKGKWPDGSLRAYGCFLVDWFVGHETKGGGRNESPEEEENRRQRCRHGLTKHKRYVFWDNNGECKRMKLWKILQLRGGKLRELILNYINTFIKWMRSDLWIIMGINGAQILRGKRELA